MKPYWLKVETSGWKRTGFVVLLVAGGMILLLVLLGPVVYLVRVTVQFCIAEWRKLVQEYRDWKEAA